MAEARLLRVRLVRLAHEIELRQVDDDDDDDDAPTLRLDEPITHARAVFAIGLYCS